MFSESVAFFRVTTAVNSNAKSVFSVENVSRAIPGNRSSKWQRLVVRASRYFQPRQTPVHEQAKNWNSVPCLWKARKQHPRFGQLLLQQQQRLVSSNRSLVHVVQAEFTYTPLNRDLASTHAPMHARPQTGMESRNLVLAPRCTQRRANHTSTHCQIRAQRQERVD